MYKNVFRLMFTLFVGLLLVTACNKESGKEATFLDKAAAFHKQLSGVNFDAVESDLDSDAASTFFSNGLGEIKAFAALTSDEIKDETKVKAAHKALVTKLPLAHVKEHRGEFDKVATKKDTLKKFAAAVKSSEFENFLSATVK